ncbi:hypothetical protein CBR_g45765 [Chara braunii]|uniref:Reverse transcriptase domain-containing protein n=1 Tax=Chara braunii TaxID=69332 RepID=A0A388LZD1_CHABU|nr:hypothetical protein CBR_g45765 [Chara braunii]|eukprot:GBG87613.1 hypothetical protein CBR_g45765 [Chara braunii]
MANITSAQWQTILDAADENEKPFFQKLYDDAVQREREVEAATIAANIADQVALLRIPEANADRFQERLAAAVATLVRLRTLEDLESRVTTLEQRNQELQAEILSLRQSQLSAPRPPNPRPAAVPVSQSNTILMTRASGTVTSAGTGASSSSGSAGSCALVIVPNAGTSAQNATVLTGVQYSGPVVDKRAATLSSKYDGKADITSWISSMRSYFEVMRTPQEDRSMIMGTNTEPAVRNHIELQAIAAGYERIDLTEWLKVTPVRTLEDLLITRYQDKHAALKARLKLEALKGQIWRSSMQALEQHLTGLFTTPDLGMTDVSCMDVVMGVAPKEYLSLLALKNHTTWRELMTDLVNLEAKDLARRKKAPAAGGTPQRKRYGSSNQLALHEHREAEDQSYADDLSLDNDLEPDSDIGCSTSTIESNRAMNVTFQIFVNKTRLTQEMINFCDIVYIDDILVYSKTYHGHAQHIEWTLGALRDAGFKIALEKSEFFLSEILFLGYVVTRGGLRPDSRKVATVKNAPVPTSLTQVRAFLGLASYHRRFIKGFVAIARPLTNLLRKDQPLSWDAECEQAFATLKDALATTPILIRPDPTKQFILITDYQPEAISAILAQKGSDGREHIIEYASRTVPDERRNDSAPQGECYAVVWGIQHFHPYLYGQKLLLVTDHKPLLALKRLTNYTGMIGRWAVLLKEYDFDVIHRKIERHGNTDGLTHLHRPAKERAVAEEVEVEDESEEETAEKEGSYNEYSEEESGGEEEEEEEEEDQLEEEEESEWETLGEEADCTEAQEEDPEASQRREEIAARKQPLEFVSGADLPISNDPTKDPGPPKNDDRDPTAETSSAPARRRRSRSRSPSPRPRV